jgi:CubicO group peptidase (beta-lactamase class C family)
MYRDIRSRFARSLLLITAVLAIALALPVRAQQAPRTDSTGLAAVLQPFVDSHSLAGAVILVADKDKVLDIETIGFADVAAGRPMRPDSLFWIASQSKPITATALMILVDEGKVKLDEPVATYLPEFKDQWLTVERDKEYMALRKPDQPITVRNILSHTSGMPPRSALEKPTLDLLPLRVAVGSYAMTPLDFAPGSNYTYSNAGINTAGRIIEVTSGVPYEDFLQTRLFGPLGMKDTTFWPGDEQLERLAKSYKPNAEKNNLVETPIAQLKYPLSDRSRQPMPAGGLFSTAADLARFCQMILSGGVSGGKRYLSETAVKEMTTRQTSASLKQSYGLGWATGGGTFGHGGAYATNMTIDPKSGLITIFMVQHAGFPGEGKKSLSAFQRAAQDRFANTQN